MTDAVVASGSRRELAHAVVKAKPDALRLKIGSGRTVLDDGVLVAASKNAIRFAPAAAGNRRKANAEACNDAQAVASRKNLAAEQTRIALKARRASGPMMSIRKPTCQPAVGWAC